MSKKILIVDDDPSFVDAVAALLREKGYGIVSAGNGKKGVDRAKENKPDLILLDVIMTTKSDGFDISRELKKDPLTKDIPVIIITGIRKEMNLAFGFEPDETWLPVKLVLEKPIKPEVLLKAVQEIIGQ